MFFSRNSTAIFITGSKIYWAVFSRWGKMKGEMKIDEWTKETLLPALEKIAKNGSGAARIILGEEFSYVTALLSQEKSRADISKKAQEVIPETLSENWDFQRKKNPDFPLQLAAVQQNFLSDLADNLKKAALKVEVLEPQSIALGRMLPQKGLYLFIAKDEKVLFGAIKDGVVVSTYVTSDEKAIADFPHFLSYVRNKYQADPECVFVNSEINPESPVFPENGIEAKVFDLNVLLGAMRKKHIRGDDARVMNIVWKSK